MAMLYLSNRVCSSLAAHIIYSTTNSIRESIRLSAEADGFTSIFYDTEFYAKVCLPIGKNRELKRITSVKNKSSKHWRECSVNEQIEIWWNRMFMTRDLIDVSMANRVPSNETNFETNVSKLWKRIEKAWNLNTQVKIIDLCSTENSEAFKTFTLRVQFVSHLYDN